MPRIIASFFSYGYSYMLMSQYSNSFYDGLLPLYYTSQFCNSIVLYDARRTLVFVTLFSGTKVS